MKRLLVWAQVSALVFVSQCAAAISVSTAWEVRPTVGASTNGGGFVAGATGTDISQFNNKNAAACSSCQSSTANLSTADAVANGTTTITSATAAFSAAIVGNIIYFQGGTGSIAAVRKQVTVFTNATTITIDSAIAASVTMTMNIGGALDTITTSLLFNTAGNIIFVKATGTNTITASIVLNNNQTPSATVPMSQIIGYTTTRTDNGRATIQASTNSGITMLGGGNAGWVIRNFVLDCNSLTTCTSLGPNFYTEVSNVKAMNFTSCGLCAGQGGSNGSTTTDSEITGGVSGCIAGIENTSGLSSIERNWIHDNSCLGILSNDSTSILFNVISNNVGVTTDGIQTGSSRGLTIMNNTIYKSGRHGINVAQGELGIGGNIRNNILSDNGGFGIVGANVAGWPAQPWWDGNFYFNNTSGTRHFMDDTGTVNPINGAAPYVNTLDVIGSATPFTSAGTNNYTLNSTAGGGAAAKGTASPGALPGLSQTGSMSFGALQPTTAAGATQSGQAFTQ
jgi:parallel beta helix pectate lyase-like protein